MKVFLQKIPENKEERVVVEYHTITDEIQEIVHFTENINDYIEGIQKGERVRIPIREIYYVEAVENRTFAYLQDREIELKMRLYQFEERFEKQYFIRASKSVILNMMKLESAKPALNGRITVTLSNGEKIIVTRKYVSNLRQRLRRDDE